MSKILLTMSDVAKAAQVTRPTLYNWQNSGRFSVAAFDDRKPPRYKSDDICAWLGITADELNARLAGNGG